MLKQKNNKIRTMKVSQIYSHLRRNNIQLLPSYDVNIKIEPNLTTN